MDGLLASLDDPALALVQWNEAYAVVADRLPGSVALQLESAAAGEAGRQRARGHAWAVGECCCWVAALLPASAGSLAPASSRHALPWRHPFTACLPSRAFLRRRVGAGD